MLLQRTAVEAPDELREHQRYALAAPARVRELGSVAIAVTLKNLSVSGCCLHGADLPLLAEVWVTIRAASPLRGTIVWSAGGEAGCEFHRPLKHADMWRLLRSR